MQLRSLTGVVIGNCWFPSTIAQSPDFEAPVLTRSHAAPGCWPTFTLFVNVRDSCSFACGFSSWPAPLIVRTAPSSRERAYPCVERKAVTALVVPTFANFSTMGIDAAEIVLVGLKVYTKPVCAGSRSTHPCENRARMGQPSFIMVREKIKTPAKMGQPPGPPLR